MSNAVRHSFHQNEDSSEQAQFEALAKTAPPIVVAQADIDHAFDLFQPEPTGRTPVTQLPAPNEGPAAVVDFSDGHFARQVARALETPPPAPVLPLGGIAPTEREIAAARTLMIAWLAAFAMAAFAFFSQGPSLSTRSGDEAAPPPPAAASEQPAQATQPAQQPGDIRLEPSHDASAGRSKASARPPARTSAPKTTPSPTAPPPAAATSPKP